jgi:hypothetical protein
MEVFTPVTYPRNQLNPELRKAAQQSMRDAWMANRQRARGEVPARTGFSGAVLTTLSGFTTQSELSRALNAETVAASPRMVYRLTKLAEAIGFTGRLFVADKQEPEQSEKPAEGATL